VERRGIADQATQQLLALLHLYAVRVGQSGVTRIRTPPTLETPQSLRRLGLDRGRRRWARSHDTKTGHSVAGATRVTGLEIEEAFEQGGGAGAIGLALATIHDDHARRPGP